MKKLLIGLSLATLLLAIPAIAAPDNLSDFRKLMDRGMHWTAEAQLSAYAEKHQKSADAWALLAECRLNTGDADGAEKAAYVAVDLAEDSGEAWMLWGRAYFEKGVAAFAARLPGNTIKSHFADAEMKFRQVRKLTPGDKDVLWRLGWAKQWQEYSKEARRYFEEQIEKFPKHPAGYWRLGQMIADEAKAIGNGVTPEAKAHRKKAIECFEKGLKAAGDHAEMLYSLGIALEWNGRKSDAKVVYLRAVSADPDYQNAWTRAHELGVPTKDLLALAEKLLKEHKNAATPALWAGFFRNGAKEYELALKVLLPALKEHGDNVGVYTQAFTAANSLLRQRKTDVVLERKRKTAVALEAFMKIHEAYAWAGDAANNVGLHFRDTKQYTDSLTWYLKSAERAPNSQGIQNDTGLIYLFHTRGNERKKSLPFFEKTLALVNDDGQPPEMGYWDALANLCLYYWEVDRQPEKVIEYADMRGAEKDGEKPYSKSKVAEHHKRLAEKALGR